MDYAAPRAEPTATVGALYAEHWEPVYWFLRARMPGAPDADVEDLAATVFERVVRFSDRYEERGRARPWLLDIAANLLVDRARHWACRPREVAVDSESPGGRATVDAGSARHDLVLDVARVLARLPERQRIAIVERYWAGGTAADTALLMGTTEDGVKKLLWWGKRRLRRELEAMGWSA